MYAIVLKIIDTKRTILFCAITLLLHLGALQWAGQHLAAPAPARGTTSMNVRFSQASAPLVTQAITAPPMPTVPAVPAMSKPIPARTLPKKSKPRNPSLAPPGMTDLAANPGASPDTRADAGINAPAPVNAQAESTGATTADTTTNTTADTTANTTANTTAETTKDIAGTPASPGDPASQTTPPTKTYRVQLPPSAELQYAVRKVDGKQANAAPTTGRGKIRWINQGGRYRIEGDVTFLFFTLLNFQSEGDLGTNGIAPVLYTEKRTTRARTNTHFQRANKVISFSASARQFPLTDDAQDRASVLWQLAGIGQGDSANLNVAAMIDIQVASEREAESWHFLVSGVESITLEQGQLQAWHFTRIPRPGTYERQLDVWLSPTHHWAPVRIRDTEVNGTFTEMSMTNFTTLP